MELPNDNVVTVRLPPKTVDHVKALALKHGTTRSTILREAVVDFVRRNLGARVFGMNLDEAWERRPFRCRSFAFSSLKGFHCRIGAGLRKKRRRATQK